MVGGGVFPYSSQSFKSLTLGLFSCIVRCSVLVLCSCAFNGQVPNVDRGRFNLVVAERQGNARCRRERHQRRDIHALVQHDSTPEWPSAESDDRHDSQRRVPSSHRPHQLVQRQCRVQRGGGDVVVDSEQLDAGT